METNILFDKLTSLYPTFSNTLRNQCIAYCETTSIGDLVAEIGANTIQLQGFIKGLLDLEKLEFDVVMKLFAKFGMLEQFAFMLNTLEDDTEEEKKGEA